MADPALACHGLVKRFGALHANDGVSLDLRPGEIHALIGPNGAGKSTLVAQIAGALRPDAGAVHFLGRNVTALGPAARARMGLARSFQVSAVVPDFTVLQNVAVAVAGGRGGSFRFFRALLADAAVTGAADDAIARAGLDARRAVRAGELAHGERRRLELAMALALAPRAFLLDEPMAGLGQDGTAAMTRLLDRLRETAPILLVEHDMDAVFRLADRVTVMVDGRVLATGLPAAIRADASVRRAYLGNGVPA